MEQNGKRKLTLQETFELFIPDPETFDFSIESLTQRTKEIAGKEIIILPVEPTVGFFGGRMILDFLGKDIEYVVYNSALPAFHSDHVKVHELAHIMLEHETQHLRPEDLETSNLKLLRALAGITCRAVDVPRPGVSRGREDQDAETLTRLIYRHAIDAWEKHKLRRHSSQSLYEGLLRSLTTK